ncbi:unnamed protein product [Closterium sp. NIES-53]
MDLYTSLIPKHPISQLPLVRTCPIRASAHPSLGKLTEGDEVGLEIRNEENVVQHHRFAIRSLECSLSRTSHLQRVSRGRAHLIDRCSSYVIKQLLARRHRPSSAHVQHLIVQGMQLCSNLCRGVYLLPLLSNMKELACVALLLLLCTAVALRVVDRRIGDHVRVVFLVPPRAAILVTILGGPSIGFLIARKPGVPLLLTIPATPFHLATSTRLAPKSRFRTATPTGTSLLVAGVVVLLCTASSTTEATSSATSAPLHPVAAAAVIIGEEPRQSDPALQEDWDERASAGYYLMSQSLELNQRHHVMHLLPEVDCGPKAWTVLKELHASTSVVATLMLERELSALRLSEGEPVQPVLDKMRNLYKLGTAGITYPEQTKCLKMLSLLPELWSGLSLPQNQSLWTLEWVRTKILEEDFCRRQLRDGDDDSSGYGMQGSRRGRGRCFGGAGRDAKKDDDSKDQQGGTGWGRGAKSGRGCKSGAGGKMKGSCWNQKNGANMVADSLDHNPKSNGGAEKNKERTAGQFFHIGEQREQGDASAKVGAELRPLDYWVLDTGAAWTMTPRKELLDDVRAAPINEMCSASGHALKVAGVGRAAFKGADGKPVVLHDVLLVPDLKANLISLRKLAKAGVSTSMDGARTYKGQLGNRVLWDLHESKDVYRSIAVLVCSWVNMEAEVSAPAGPSGSGGVRGTREAGRGVVGGSAPIASVSTPAKDDVKAFNLEKFSGEDWASWSFRMELLFNHYGLLEVMDGELKRHASEGATKEWDRRSKDGFFLLSQFLSSNQLHHVKHLIKDIQCDLKGWKILKDVHAPTSEAMLSAAGVDYAEKIKCYKALSLLPESWGPLVVNLNGLKDSWSLEWIRAQVLQEEFRRKELTAVAGEGGGSAYGMKVFKRHGSKKGKAKEHSVGEQYSGGKSGNKGGKRCGGSVGIAMWKVTRG